jgi:hypothetical protein
MYKNLVNLAKNRMVLTLQGATELGELQAWSLDLLSQLKKLKPGFGVISDILEWPAHHGTGQAADSRNPKSCQGNGNGPRCPDRQIL